MNRQEQTLERLAHYAAELAAAEAAAAKARPKVHEWITKAVDAGVASGEVARVAGVSKGRVSQLAPVPSTPQTRFHAQKDGAGDSCVNDPDTVPGLPDTSVPVLSGAVSVRRVRRLGRETLWVDTRDTTDVSALLMRAGLTGAADVRVMLVGPPPLDLSTGATHAEAVRAWALGPVPVDEWTPGDHHLGRPMLPTLRYTLGTGQRVTIMRAAAWWGETDADVATCRAAWDRLGTLLDEVSAFRGAGLADTPQSTGVALWRRTIPEAAGFPVLSDEYRQLIAATAGQGRVELRALPGSDLTRAGEPVEPRDFTYVDGRLMYAALTWGMPVGEPTRWSGGQLDGLDARTYERTLRGRGRWKITATVPEGWEHVGLLMAPEASGRWHYPATPGQTFTTWADGAEVWLALTHGWGIVVHEGLTWAEGKPLDTWTRHLLGLWEQANAAADRSPVARLVRAALRSIIVNTIGTFAAQGHPVTRTAHRDDAASVPAGAEVRMVGDWLVWSEDRPPTAATLETAHPEWSATVWARARVRLLTSRDGSGALNLDPARVVGFATDALYLAGGEPGWADDGKPGRFRVKGHRPGPFVWPATFTDLWTLRDESEG